MDTQDYKSERCKVGFLSELSGADAEMLVGKTVARIEAHEFSLTLHFTDNSTIKVKGSLRDGAPLGVECSEPSVEPYTTSPR